MTNSVAGSLWRVASLAGVVFGGISLLVSAVEIGSSGADGHVALLLIAGVIAGVAGILGLRGKTNLVPVLLSVALGVKVLSILTSVIVAGWLLLYQLPLIGAYLELSRFGLSLPSVVLVAYNLSFAFLIVGVICAFVAASRGRSLTDQVTVGSENRSELGVEETSEKVVTTLNGPVPAGWYADPDGKPADRYWDGSAWTNQTRPLTTRANPMMTQSKVVLDDFGQPVSPRSRAVAAILCFLLGVLGIHRFYVGKVGTGIAQIFTIGGLGIWALVDFIMILVGSFKDIEGRRLINW